MEFRLRDLLGFVVECEINEARARRIHGQTLRNKRKKQQEQANSEETTSATTEESTDSSQNPAIGESTSTNQVDANNTPNEPMGDQTIRELAATPTVQQPLCITFPQGTTPFQLKTGLIHLLPVDTGKNRSTGDDGLMSSCHGRVGDR
ncbi:hypothetical protein GQ457_07G001480 [Hibiscus cannabinus]